MVRAFLETLFVCSKSFTDKGESKDYINEHLSPTLHPLTLDETRSRLHASSLREAEANRRSHSVAGCPIDNVGIFQANGHQVGNEHQQNASTRATCATPEQTTHHLVEDIRLARDRLINYQGLDKWVEKWQEIEFMRLTRRSCKVMSRSAESKKHSGFATPGRARRKSAQGRALSERAQLSAKHCQRREQLIRKVLEVVGRPKKQATITDAGTKGTAVETFDLTNDNESEAPLIHIEPNKQKPQMYSPMIPESIADPDNNPIKQRRIHMGESFAVQQERSEHQLDPLLESYREAESNVINNVKRVIEGDRHTSLSFCSEDERGKCASDKLLPEISSYELSPGSQNRYLQESCGDGLVSVSSTKMEHTVDAIDMQISKETLGRICAPVMQGPCDSAYKPALTQNEKAKQIENYSKRVESIWTDEFSKRKHRNFCQTENDKNRLSYSASGSDTAVNVVKNSTSIISHLAEQKKMHVSDRQSQHTQYVGNLTLSSQTVIDGTALNRRLGLPIDHIASQARANRWTYDNSGHQLGLCPAQNSKSRAINAISHEKQHAANHFEDLQTSGTYHVQSVPQPGQSGSTVYGGLLKLPNEMKKSKSNKIEKECEFPIPYLCLPDSIPCQISFQLVGRGPVQFLSENYRADKTTSIRVCNSPAQQFTDILVGKHHYRSATPATTAKNNNGNTNNNNRDGYKNTGILREHCTYPQSPITMKPKMRRLMAVLGSKIYRWPKRSKEGKLNRYDFQSNNEEFDPHVREPLPLMRLEDMHSYTLTSSTTTHVCDGKAKTEDQTSDTFILSAASEFLHSTSDDTFAFKHRPRPGIASGRRKRKPSQATTADTGSRNEKAKPNMQFTATADEHVLFDQSEKDIEQEVVELNTVPTNSSVSSNLTDPPASEDDLVLQHALPSRLPSVELVQKPAMMMTVTRDPVQSKPFRHPRIVKFKQTIQKQRKQTKILPRTHTLKINNRVQMKREKPAWNISTRNLATRFYAIRPIESILWPDGRVPRNSKSEVSKTKPSPNKCPKHHPHSVIPKKQRAMQNVKRQVNVGSSAMCALQNKNASKAECWKRYQVLFKPKRRTKNDLKSRREFLILSQKHSQIQCDSKQSNDRYKSGDFPISPVVTCVQRKRFHLNATTEEGDQLLPSAVAQNRITTRHLHGQPRLWTMAYRRLQHRSPKKPRTKHILRTQCGRNQYTSALPCRGLKHYSRTPMRSRNSQPVKIHDQKLSMHNSLPICDTKGSSSSSNNAAVEKGERSERVDFFAYVAVIPSEIDELVLPFRACNRLRTCLKNIYDLLVDLESEIAESNHKNGQISASNETIYDSEDRSKIWSPDTDKKITEHAMKSNRSNTPYNKPKKIHLLDRLKRTFTKRQLNRSEQTGHSVTPDLSMKRVQGAKAVNNNAQSASVYSDLTTHSDTIRVPKLDPERVRFWCDVLGDCQDTRLVRLLHEMECIYDRRIFAIEQRTNSRIKLNETVIYSVRGLPCMELRIIAYNVTDLQRALVCLEASLPRIYSQIVFSERFYGNIANGSEHRFPTTKSFFFPLKESAAVRQHSVSTICRIIPVIEAARELKRSRQSFGRA